MPPQQQDTIASGAESIRLGAALAQVAISTTATMYRLPYYQMFSMGSRALGPIKGAGALMIYPAIVSAAPPTTREGFLLATWGWQALAVLLVVQWVGSLFSGRHSRFIGQSYLPSSLAEAAFALGSAALAWPFCQGVAYAVAIGWLASELDIFLIKARLHRTAAIIRDSRMEAEQLQGYIEE